MFGQPRIEQTTLGKKLLFAAVVACCCPVDFRRGHFLPRASAGGRLATEADLLLELAGVAASLGLSSLNRWVVLAMLRKGGCSSLLPVSVGLLTVAVCPC